MKPFQTDSKCGLLDLQMQLTPTKLEPMEKKIGVKKVPTYAMWVQAVSLK